MAYRFEGEDIVIDGWERGISDGPYEISSPSALGPVEQTGTADLSYGNITGIPGEFSIQFPLAVSTVVTSGGVALATPVHKTAQIDAGNGGTVTKYFMLDSKGQIFSSNLVGNLVTWTYKGHVGSTGLDTTGNSGLVYWQGYLFSMRDDKIYYSNDDGVTNNDWTGTVGSLNTGCTHYAISSQVSDRMYFCNGSSVGALILNQGSVFDPTNASTYTFSLAQVNIPAYDMATCLAEINSQVLIGGALNRAYPWDALNLGGTGITSLVGQPLFLGDRFVQRIVVMNTNAYIFTGHPVIPTGRGNIYISNGSQVDLFRKMPDNIASFAGSVSDIQEPYWRFGDAMFHRNKLMFGAIAIGNISNSTIPDTGGIWSIDIGSSSLYRSSFFSSGNSTLVTVINPLDTGTAIPGLGYFAGAVGAMNNTSTTLSTSARMISDKIPVGTFFKKKTYKQIEIKTAVALATGESIDVVVITDKNPSGLSVGSMVAADGMSKAITPLNFEGIQWLQIQTTSNPTNTNPTFVRMREIRIR